MEKHSFIQLIDKYLLGSASKTERQLVDEYLRKMEDTGGVSMESEQEEGLKRATWEQLQQKIRKQPALIIQAEWHWKQIARLTGTVAAACILVTFSVWKLWERTSYPGDFQTVKLAAGRPIQKIKLVDGTLIWLKPNSTLTYPTVFNGNQREINLKGEALFEVAKDASHPFIIHSNNIDVKVLGTSFNIRDNMGKDTVEVAVLTGKVWVSPFMKTQTEKFVLTPKEKLLILKQTGFAKKEMIVFEEPYTKGTEYNMNFSNKPIDSIAKSIERKFNVFIAFDNQNHKECNISGDFTDQALTPTVEMLCKTVGAIYTFDKDTIRIKKVQCK